MADDSRIEDLRRRVHKEPASIAFAQLAEELRRAARFLEAVDVCRAGLEMYPGYLSVRVTLGRCLFELDRLDDAERELDQVRDNAPDNLAAIRALSKVRERRRAAAEARSEGAGVQPRGEIRPMPDVAAATQSSNLRPVSDWVPDQVGLKPVTTYIDRLIHVEVPTTHRGRTVNEDEYIHIIRTLTALESWLAAIHVARAGPSA